MLTIAFVTQFLTSAATAPTRIAMTGIAATARLVRALRNRRDVLRLTELDDRALKDIGLVRSEVEGALAVSWLDDPSAILAARNHARAGLGRAPREGAAPRVTLKPASPACSPSLACNA